VLTAWRRIPGPPRDPIKARLLRLYRGLLSAYGPQGWWPARTPFEVAVGAILTQHTAWGGAARAVGELGARGLLVARRLVEVDLAALGALVRPAGTYRRKARSLRDFARWLLGGFGGDFGAMRRAPLAALRREMLAVTRRRARSSKGICRPIRRCSTSSTRCWWPWPRRTVAPPLAARAVR
jgi:hypothetical protein